MTQIKLLGYASESIKVYSSSQNRWGIAEKSLNCEALPYMDLTYGEPQSNQFKPVIDGLVLPVNFAV